MRGGILFPVLLPLTVFAHPWMAASAESNADLRVFVHFSTTNFPMAYDRCTVAIEIENTSDLAIRLRDPWTPPWSVWHWFDWTVNGRAAKFHENCAILNPHELVLAPHKRTPWPRTFDPMRLDWVGPAKESPSETTQRCILTPGTYEVTILPSEAWGTHSFVPAVATVLVAKTTAPQAAGSEAIRGRSPVSRLAPAEQTVDKPALSPERAACVMNMRRIISAKGARALEARLQENAVIRVEDVSVYIKGGWAGLRCPAGGIYSIGLVGPDKSRPGTPDQAPRCSVHGSAVDFIPNK